MENVSTKKRGSHWVKICLVAVLIILAGAFVATQYVLHHVEPILRARVIQTLSQRFNSQVELDKLDVSVLKQGIEVEGQNLSLRSNLDPSLPPQISVARFNFHTTIRDLFRSPMHVGLVELHGLDIKIPPKNRRSAMPKIKKGHDRLQIMIDRIVCDDAMLVIMTDNPKKNPLQFQIRALTLQRVGPNQPMHFNAQLVNPKPIGDIASEGDFGPWNADQPHSTPIDGNYSFTHADLSTTKGIAGILSSTGRFSGPLDTITVDGQTDTPDFSVDVSGHKVALHTNFHAIVDGTNGNTYLQPVHARFLNTRITATGYVVRGAVGHGHDIYLDVSVDRGRVQDLLDIGAKTTPPVMRGALHLKTKFNLPAGTDSVSRRLQLHGTFAIDDASFANRHIQLRVDELSLRSQGHANQAKQLTQEELPSSGALPVLPASMHGTFSLGDRKLTLPQLVCKVPGAEITLAGTYTLDGKQFDFAGKARMDAHVSGIVGGWKGALLKPIDPSFAKNGAGTEVPITITGTESKPHFGVKF